MSDFEHISHYISGHITRMIVNDGSKDVIDISSTIGLEDERLYHPLNAAIALGMSFDEIDRIFLPTDWIKVNRHAVTAVYYNVPDKKLMVITSSRRYFLDADEVYRTLCRPYAETDLGLQGYIAEEAQRMASTWIDHDTDKSFDVVEDPLRIWANEQLSGAVVSGWAEDVIGDYYTYLEAVVLDDTLVPGRGVFDAIRYGASTWDIFSHHTDYGTEHNSEFHFSDSDVFLIPSDPVIREYGGVSKNLSKDM